ncbi:hypothetical protein JQ615_07665 [Bradyrhizobium jicamae]|uniref:Transposase n=1 Tax=Bradyrhizobium jicamae TaxID=280332 RepID=A0ABS5FEQ0_9BRAD|nr:hypothetical protein [Bradyrhizobium jicamae]MBR0795260.1 hypothetical protein [Bradyrhizobium jicamae]
MTKHALDNQRIEELLRGLRERTTEEITEGLMLLGGHYTPEMIRALELFVAERNAEPKKN